MKTKFLPQVFIIYTRFLIGGAFVFASLIKIKGHRFTTESGADHPINTAWHFFETMYQSGLYWKFIGLGQLAAGFLLMTQRYAKLGAVVNMPIIANIFVVTMSYDFAYTPVVTGLILCANLMLVAWDWNELRLLVNLPPILATSPRLENDKVWEWTGLGLFLFTFLYRVLINQYNIFFWFVVCFVMGSVGLVVGWRRRKNYEYT